MSLEELRDKLFGVSSIPDSPESVRSWIAGKAGQWIIERRIF